MGGQKVSAWTPVTVESKGQGTSHWVSGSGSWMAPFPRKSRPGGDADMGWGIQSLRFLGGPRVGSGAICMQSGWGREITQRG